MSATANTQLIEAAKKGDVAGIQAALKSVSGRARACCLGALHRPTRGVQRWTAVWRVREGR